MKSQLLCAFSFWIVSTAILSAGGTLVVYKIFSNDSGWQQVFSTIDVVLSAFGSLLASASFFIGVRIYRALMTPVRAAIFAAMIIGISVSLSFCIGLIVGSLSGVISAYWVFWLLFIAGSFFSPEVARGMANKRQQSDS